MTLLSPRAQPGELVNGCEARLALARGHAVPLSQTHAALLQADQFVRVIVQRQGLKVACVEETAYRKGLVGAEQLVQPAELSLKK